MAKSMSIKLELVAPLPQIAITRFTYNAVEFYGPQGPRYKEVDLYIYIWTRLGLENFQFSGTYFYMFQIYSEFSLTLSPHVRL